MKNITKFLGIIAAVAVIGFVTGCGEPDPDDRIEINITGLPSNADGLYADVSLYSAKDTTVSPVARSSAVRLITGNTARGEMVTFEGGQTNFAKEGPYFVRLEVYEDAEKNTRLKDYITASNVSIVKGTNGILASRFQPEPVASDFPAKAVVLPNAPAETFFGIYKVTYTGTVGNNTSATVVETIDFAQTTFKISDDTDDGVDDHLYFDISKWDEVTVPTPHNSTYDKGYKFTGKITSAEAKKVTGTAGSTSTYLYGSKTAPGFLASDINTTTCKMYIYTKGSGNSFTFIRTTFVKDSDTAVPAPITGNDGTTVRVYTKSS